MSKHFDCVIVSRDLHHMLRDLEKAVLRHHTSATPGEEAEAYLRLCYSRKFLYEYLEELERMAGIDAPTTTLRFL